MAINSVPENPISDPEAFLLSLVESETASTSDDDDYLSFLENRSVKRPSTKIFRYYTLIATSIDETITIPNLVSTVASRYRNKYRRLGFKVDLIENGSGDGTVIRIPDTLDGKGVPNPVPYDSPRIRSRNRGKADKIRSLMMNAENAKLKRIAEKKQNEKCFVYEKSDNSIRFSGDIDELTAYLNYLNDNGNLDMNRIVVYVPDSLMRK